jgi:hypothetical protein
VRPQGVGGFMYLRWRLRLLDNPCGLGGSRVEAPCLVIDRLGRDHSHPRHRPSYAFAIRFEALSQSHRLGSLLFFLLFFQGLTPRWRFLEEAVRQLGIVTSVSLFKLLLGKAFRIL